MIDAFAGLIVGWECSGSKRQRFVQSAIHQAGGFRRLQGNPLPGGTIHHSDAGSQYTAIRFGETLELEGLVPSIGTVADALDNALAETTIGLYKTECVREDSPFRTGPLTRLDDVENVTSRWTVQDVSVSRFCRTRSIESWGDDNRGNRCCAWTSRATR